MSPTVFRTGKFEDVCDVTLLHGEHLHWARLDIDLHVDSIEHPERFPLVAGGRRRASRQTRR